MTIHHWPNNVKFGPVNSEMALKNLDEFSQKEFSDFINSFDTVLTDCDGVLWLEDEKFPGSDEVMNRFKALGKKTYFVTNNSAKTREELLQKCHNLGIKATIDEMIGSAYLAAIYLNNVNFDKNKKVYVIGTKGITQELDKLGIRHCGSGPDIITTDAPSFQSTLKLETDIGAVIVGFDEHFSFPKLMKASCYLNDPNVYFIATNTDNRRPNKYNLVSPGAGSLIGAVKICAERDPFIVGKPEAYVSDTIAKQNGLNPKRTLMIGDACRTDILLGTRCGFQTLLVLTGVTSLPEVMRWKDEGDKTKVGWIPDFYTTMLGDLLDRMI